jgi:hypothetical protein
MALSSAFLFLVKLNPRSQTNKAARGKRRAVMLHQLRSSEYSSSPAPIAKKKTKRRKKRGPIMAASRNQNLIASLSVNLSQTQSMYALGRSSVYSQNVRNSK